MTSGSTSLCRIMANVLRDGRLAADAWPRERLKPTKNDGVSTIDGRSVADPGFLTALQNISKSTNK